MKKLLICLIFAALLIPIRSVCALSVKISPELSEPVRIGETFEIDILIEDAADFAGFEFELSYDPAVVIAEDAAVGDFPGSTGRTVRQSAPRIDNTAGKLTFGAVTFGDNPGPDGNGILASITLALQSLNTGKVNFAGAQIGDTANAFLTPDESIGSEVIPKYKIGDLNQDGHTNLADLLIALKVTAGMNETWASPDADTDGDKKIGLEEAVHILQVVAGIRD